MQTNPAKQTISKFPLRLMPSVRRVAEEFSQKEGVSLNQFINLAVAEKLVHLQHEEWLASRSAPTPELRARALELLDGDGNQPPGHDDELPQGYEPDRTPQDYASPSKNALQEQV